MSITQNIAQNLGLSSTKIGAVIDLIDHKNTIPFIARYRKEVTGNLDEEQIRSIVDLLKKFRALEERRSAILKSIESQSALTPALEKALDAASTRTELEDLYQPYKPRRRTRASQAREQGLQPLADLILKQSLTGKSLKTLAQPHLSDEITTVNDVWAGARDIVAETISDHPEVRRITRSKAQQWGSQRAAKIKRAEDPRGIYQDYYDFDIRLDRLRPHQILALNRGEAEKVLRVKIEIPERDWRKAINRCFPINSRSPFASQLELASEDSAKRLLLPAIERELRRSLTERAEAHAINVFAENLRNLLLQPPLAGHNILGIDPGYRTGCKVAVIDSTGKVLDTAAIYPHPPQNQTKQAAETLSKLVRTHRVSLITIGNGTASRETEQLVADLISGLDEYELHYLIVSEAGASVYSASPLARQELPALDVSIRGAVSIARRAQDPLAELVKIDPKSIGVGMYQHDIDQKELNETLSGVVESVVNQVGVDLNTASPALLTHVSGIGPTLATRIIAQRDQRGSFRERSALRAVTGLGPKAFEQAAGFLRIRDGDNPLDASSIHPESYPIARKVLRRADISSGASSTERQAALQKLQAESSFEDLALELGAGVPTLEDIFDQLIRPGRDPRADLPAPILREDVLKLEDLASGMRLKGTVRNVVDFGVFVDIGVKQDGLLHKSQIPRGQKLRVGEIIIVEILKVEPERGRISLRL